MCEELKPYYNIKALKKRFKDMTQCLDCGHLDAFQSCRYHETELDKHGLKKVISVCCGCGSTNIKRRRTIQLARIFYSTSKKAGEPWIHSDKIQEMEDYDSAPKGGECQ